MWTCNSFQRGFRSCALYVGCEWSCSLPSVSYCWWSVCSTIHPCLSLLQSVILLACCLNDSHCEPAVLLYCYSLQGTVLQDLKCFLFVFFLIYLCVKYYKPVTVWYRTTDCVDWVPWLTLLELQIGFVNMPSECNLFICKGFTVIQIIRMLLLPSFNLN